MAKRTPQQVGKYASSAGKEAERAVVRAMRARGFPTAERREKTGYRGRHETRPDLGDIEGIGALVVQVKRYRGEPSDLQVADWLAKTTTQQTAAGADYGILVVKRHGKADAGNWWAYMAGEEYARLLGAHVEHLAAYPVRILFAHLLETLVDDGYGDEESLAA